MARYRKIDIRMWGDDRFKSLSQLQPSAQALWIYLLTGPHTTMIPGLSRIGQAACAEELNWPIDDFRRCWSEIEAQGIATASWRDKVIWIPNAIKYDPPRAPDNVTAWGDIWDLIPECDLKTQAAIALHKALSQANPKTAEAFERVAKTTNFQLYKPKAEPKARPKVGPKVGPQGRAPDQDQDQDQEGGKSSQAPAREPGAVGPDGGGTPPENTDAPPTFPSPENTEQARPPIQNEQTANQPGREAASEGRPSQTSSTASTTAPPKTKTETKYKTHDLNGALIHYCPGSRLARPWVRPVTLGDLVKLCPRRGGRPENRLRAWREMVPDYQTARQIIIGTKLLAEAEDWADEGRRDSPWPEDVLADELWRAGRFEPSEWSGPRPQIADCSSREAILAWIGPAWLEALRAPCDTDAEHWWSQFCEAYDLTPEGAQEMTPERWFWAWEWQKRPGDYHDKDGRWEWPEDFPTREQFGRDDWRGLERAQIAYFAARPTSESPRARVIQIRPAAVAEPDSGDFSDDFAVYDGSQR